MNSTGRRTAMATIALLAMARAQEDSNDLGMMMTTTSISIGEQKPVENHIFHETATIVDIHNKDNKTEEPVEVMLISEPELNLISEPVAMLISEPEVNLISEPEVIVITEPMIEEKTETDQEQDALDKINDLIEIFCESADDSDSGESSSDSSDSDEETFIDEPMFLQDEPLVEPMPEVELEVDELKLVVQPKVEISVSQMDEMESVPQPPKKTKKGKKNDPWLCKQAKEMHKEAQKYHNADTEGKHEIEDDWSIDAGREVFKIFDSAHMLKAGCVSMTALAFAIAF